MSDLFWFPLIHVRPYTVCVQKQSGNDRVNWKHRLCDVRFLESAGANVQGAQVTIWGAKNGNHYSKRFSITVK